MTQASVANKAMERFTASVELCTVKCGVCGGVYAILEDYREQQWEKGKSWHCPYCEIGWGYAGAGEYDRLKKAAEQASSRAVFYADQAKAAERSRRATAGHLTRTKRRIAAGVCPCCNRHFINLERHITTKHPRYQKEAVRKE